MRLWTGRPDRRVNLVIAAEEIAAVVDIRRRRVRDRDRQSFLRGIGTGHLLAEHKGGSARGMRIPEIAGAVLDEPHAHPIAVGRRRAVGVTWLAAVFGIDSADD